MISFILPTLNEERILGDTLRRLQSGLCLDAEIIVSDGGSTDRTRQIALRLGVSVIEDSGGHRKNIPGGKNAGAEHAKGDLLIFLDADVYFAKPEKFCAQVIELFRSRPDLIAIVPMLRVDPSQATLADRIIFAFGNLFHRLMNNVLHFGSGSGECQIVRASAFRTIGGFREELSVCEDNDLFSRLAKNGRTLAATGLTAFHSGRRAHKIGWPTLLASWWINWIFVVLFKKSYHSEWKEVR